MTQRLVQLRVIGLGLLVGAILHSEATAQVVPPVRSDSAQRDSVRAKQVADSIAKAVADSLHKADTLRTPIPGFRVLGINDEEYVWRGDEILASSAVSLTELVSRVPGAAAFRGGFLTSPNAPAYMGCFRCVRYFLDGIEIAAPDNRSGGVLDNTEIPLLQLSEVRVVRGANEVRVYLKTWGVVRTIPYSRIDILTGGDETTQFGAYLGKRYNSGAVFQVAVQQFGTTSRVNTGSGNRSVVSGRIGIVKESYGIDAYAIRTARTRDAQNNEGGLASLSAFEGSRTDAYVRFSLGNQDKGPWLQAIASTANVSEKTPGTGPTSPAEGEPGADSSRTQSQYVLAGGTRISGINLLGTARFRALDGFHSNELAVNAAASVSGIDVAAYLRRDTRDSLVAAELSLRADPIALLSISGSAGQLSAIGNSQRPSGLFARADVGVHIARATLHGGLLLRDSSFLAAPTVFDAALTGRSEGDALGIYGRLNGPIWRDIQADITTVHWDADGWYRPGQLTRASLYVDSWFLKRFPNRTFHFHAGVTYETRGDTRFPLGAGGQAIAPSHSSISSLVEIRILSVVITWQDRNIRGLEMSEVPGLGLPRRLSVYGIRWELWN